MWLEKRSGTQALGAAECVNEFLATFRSFLVVIFYLTHLQQHGSYSFYIVSVANGDLIFASVLQ